MRQAIILIFLLFGSILILLNLFGYDKMRYECNSKVFTNNGEELTPQIVFMDFKIPKSFWFWNTSGRVIIEIAQIQFLSKANYSMNSGQLSDTKIYIESLNGNDEKYKALSFRGDFSMISNMAFISDQDAIYKMTCKSKTLN